MNFPLKYQVIGLALISALLPALVVTYLVSSKESPLVKRVDVEIDALITQQLKETLEEVYGLCETSNDLVKQQVSENLNVARFLLRELGDVNFTQNQLVQWNAINQFTRKSVSIELPRMNVGDTWLGQNTNSTVETPVVDQVRRLVGGTVTIFQRMNTEGDMLRVATNEIGRAHV